MCVFEIFWRLGYKGCLLHKCFCCHPDGQCSLPSVRILEELSVTVTTCVKKYGLWRLFLLAWGVWLYTKVKPGQHLLLDLSGRYHFDCIPQLIQEYIVLSCHLLPIGVRICSNGTSKSMVCIMNRNKYSIIGKDLGQVLNWLLRFTRSPDDGSANLCTLVTFQRKAYFTFHRRLKRRRRTGPFRAKLTCKCPLVCAMTYNCFLKLYFYLSSNFVRDLHFSIFPKGFYFSVRRSV